MQQRNFLNTNTQSPMKNELDAAAALRAELEVELKNKKQCTYQSYECTQLSLDGYDFCSKHILQDKNAPFKQCSYIYNTNGKRCHLPAPRGDRKDYGYCSEHALKATLTRNKHNSKYPPPCTAETLLHSLSHYVKKPRIRSSSSSTQHSDEGERMMPDEGDQKVTKSQDPFTELDACSIYNEHCNQILDFCSESESDIEASTFSSVWHDAQADSSDGESIDSEQEDILKHANVYTAEEVTLITRDKLIRLQSLYIEQYRHLQYLLKERRRKYLHSLKREKETCCNIYNQVRDNPKEQRLYKKLKALNNYHKYHGDDAILNKRLKEMRVKGTDGYNAKGQMYSKCLFSEGGVKCGERSLPLSKYCQRHILEDTNQVLFKACGVLTGGVNCPTPIAAIFDESTCPLHLEIPPLRSYSIPRKDSESDVDETSDTHMHFSSHLSDNVKTEFINYDIPPEIPKMETLPSLLFEENTQTTNESSNGTDFMMKNNKPVLEENPEMKTELSEELVDETNAMQGVSDEVEINLRVEGPEESSTDISEIKTETVDVNDMVVVEESTDIETTVVDDDSVMEVGTEDSSYLKNSLQNMPSLSIAQDSEIEMTTRESVVGERISTEPSEVKSEVQNQTHTFEMIETETVTQNYVAKTVDVVEQQETAISCVYSKNEHKEPELIQRERVSVKDEMDVDVVEIKVSDIGGLGNGANEEWEKSQKDSALEEKKQELCSVENNEVT
ncbi:hypothetical protein JTB14_007745 [Gonioctena quinquepunctata]|nr:hypothetical protein JTB14_007745 [Gonioctena quinquepunctata]